MTAPPHPALTRIGDSLSPLPTSTNISSPPRFGLFFFFLLLLFSSLIFAWIILPRILLSNLVSNFAKSRAVPLQLPQCYRHFYPLPFRFTDANLPLSTKQIGLRRSRFPFSFSLPHTHHLLRLSFGAHKHVGRSQALCGKFFLNTAIPLPSFLFFVQSFFRFTYPPTPLLTFDT